jgi:hypothetical protein
MWFTNSVPYQLWLDLYDQLVTDTANDKKTNKKRRWWQRKEED